MLIIVLPRITPEILFYHEIANLGSLAALERVECIDGLASVARFNEMQVEWVQENYRDAIVTLDDTLTSPTVVQLTQGSTAPVVVDRWWEGPGTGTLTGDPDVYSHLQTLIDRLFGSCEYTVYEK